MIALDLEATGPDPACDRIIEVGIATERETRRWLVNPGRPIPAAVTALTRIANADVDGMPPFSAVADMVASLLRGQVLVTFGGHRFDVPLLDAEFERAGIAFEFGPVIDCGTLYKIFHPRHLAAAVSHYCHRDHADAHTAVADAQAARDVLLAQQLQHRDVLGAMTPDQIALFSNHGRKPADPAGKLAWDDRGRLVFNTHRNRLVPVLDDVGYARWMLNTPDFPASTKRMLRAELDAAERAALQPEPGLFDAVPQPAGD